MRPRKAPFVEAQQIADPEEVPDLLAISVDRDGLAGECGDRKPSDPALILDTELARTIDTRLAHDDRVQSVHTGIVPNILVGSTFRAAIGRMEIESLVL